MANQTLNMLAMGLKSYYKNAEETKKIVITAAAAAAALDGLGGLVPGLSLVTTIGSCFVAVWTMYAKICKKLGINLSENTLKLIGKAVISNLAANLAGLLGGLAVALFVPAASIPAAMLLAFITVYIAGIIFLKLVLKMAEKSDDIKSFSDISVSEMEDFAKNAEVSVDYVREAKQAHKDNK